jgi:tetratricopeptide (TPR) repeat protein
MEEAVAALRRCIALEPTNPDGYHRLGYCLMLLGRYPEAAAALEACIARDPHRSAAHRDLGKAHIAQREWGKAADSYRRAGELAPPGDGELWFEYAAVQLLAGDRAGYRRSCARLLELGAARAPDVRSYHVARAWTLAPIADADSTRVSALAARELKRFSSEFWSLTEQGALLCRAGRAKEAVPLLERSLAANEKPGAAVLNWLWLALAHHQLGRPDEARALRDRARAWLDEREGEKPDRAREFGLHLHNWLEARALQRELDDLLR